MSNVRQTRDANNDDDTHKSTKHELWEAMERVSEQVNRLTTLIDER